MVAETLLDIVILNWRTPELTLACIESVRTASPSAHIIVVDNGSADGSLEKIRARAGPDVTIVSNPVNVGFGAGMNAGIRAGSRPYVIVLNSDARPVAGAFSRMITRCESDATIAAVTPRVVDGTGATLGLYPPEPRPLSVVIAMLPGAWRLSGASSSNVPPELVTWFSSMCATLFRRSAFAEVGNFDEHYFLGTEEWDVGRRLKDAGYRVVLEPNAEVVHLVAASTPSAARPWRARMGRRSHQYFLRTHHGRFWGAMGMIALQISEAYMAVKDRSAQQPK